MPAHSALTRASKRLAFVLRHDPGSIGLQLDAAGWVRVDDLLERWGSGQGGLSRADLDAIVEQDSKGRYTIARRGDRDWIRAAQGHSVKVALGLEPVQPPEVLYHGTVERFLDAISAQGLLPGSRQHVHLSSDRQTAEAVGRRRGQPSILRVDAAAAHAAGVRFYLADNGVWLADPVAPTYLTLL